MPRIDPLSLLKCLSVLLGPTGGIKSKEEVHRLANLMTKFSKKLVSKCIYIQILKTTNAELLSQFMGAGGWNLIHMWLTDGILAKNWALIQELLELLLLCPVDIERLKSNNCPKLIKGLSKEGSQEAVQILAGRLVEQWLKIVKGEAAPNSLPPQITTNQMITTMGGQQQQQPQQQQITAIVASGQQRHQTADGIKIESHDIVDNTTTIQVQDLDLGNSSTIVQETSNTRQHQQQYQDQIHIQPVQLQIINKTMPGQTQPTQIKKQSFVVVSSASSSHPPTVPVYKITIRDGKQVLTKVETDASNITNLFNDSAKTIELNGELKQETVSKVDSNNDTTTISDCRTFNDNDVSDKVSCEVKQTPITCKNDNQNDVTDVKNDNDIKDVIGSDGNNKSSDKENRDSHKKDDKSSSSSSSDNKKSSHHSSSKSSSRHGSSSSSRSNSNSHRSSSHRSSSKSSSKSSRDKDKHSSGSSSKHSSSSSSSKSKSDRDKERDKEKEKLKKDQAEKDKATLEKVQAPSLGAKFGKIPKKKPEDEKTTGSDPLRKSSTDSRDSSKENKDKGDSKKSSPSSQGVLEKKNISISIENKKNAQETVRPKTVKTFNSKFRSTGLEEEVKPPPPRSTAGKKTTTQMDKKIVLPKLSSLKRTSPLRDTGATADKRAKLVLDSPVTPPPDDTKKGAIKLIPPKPKPMVLQESDMFMDALTASTKNKEPRKRKRRTSISKDTDSKKSEGANSILGDITRDGTSSPSSSPSGGDERSALSLKPEFKFYQDTLETDEDKDRSQDDKDDESPDDKNRDQNMDDDDDERSRTPTCDDDSQDAKAPASPDDPEDTGRKPPASPNAEIRYVDGLRSVLLLQKRKGSKKSLKWKTELESVRYFELDETERVNVTKTFTDMKQMEKQNEREAFQMARKLSTEDLMEERTRWNILIPIDLPAALVEPGKDSKEKDIQYAREKGILQALYFNRSMIPDSPAEPDEERHHLFIDAKIIPLDDLTGNKESEKDFTSIPWPEPKPQLAPVPPVPANILYPPFPQHNQAPMPGLPMQPLGMGSIIGPMSQQMPPSLIPPMNHMSGGVQDVGAGAGGWRTGDGKVVVPDISNMNNMPNMTGNIPTGYPPPIDTSIMPPGMMPPPGMFNQQDGYPGMMPPDDGNYGHMSNNFQGPGMFVPGPNFQTGPPPPPPRGAVMNPMHNANRGRGGPGWFRGGVGPIRGGGGGGVGGGGGGGGGGGVGWGGRGGGWRGNGKQPPVCRQFTKNGYCRAGDKCQYLHPGLNCPPF